MCVGVSKQSKIMFAALKMIMNAIIMIDDAMM